MIVYWAMGFAFAFGKELTKDRELKIIEGLSFSKSFFQFMKE